LGAVAVYYILTQPCSSQDFWISHFDRIYDRVVHIDLRHGRLLVGHSGLISPVQSMRLLTGKLR